jgi:predicted DNA-binding transcriptional regulator YafY
MTEWAFLTNHALVISVMARHNRITAREMSQTIGITERAVRKIIADLERDGYITKKKEGRGVKYKVNPEMKMRHETHREVEVGGFLEALGWKRRKRATRLPSPTIPPKSEILISRSEINPNDQNPKD